MKSAVAIILGRAGSKGLAGKNSADVGGRPCVSWTIDAAAEAHTVGAIAISTDDATLKSIGEARGIEVVERPADLASDRATVDDAARHACERLAIDDDRPIVILYANVPVRPAGLIDRAVTLLVESGCDSVQSYTETGKYHPWWMVRIGDNGRVCPWEGDELNHGVYRRQDLPGVRIPDGGVLTVTRRALFREIPGVGNGPHAFFGLDPRAVLTGEGDVIDIDSPTDLLVARAILGGERVGAAG